MRGIPTFLRAEGHSKSREPRGGSIAREIAGLDLESLLEQCFADFFYFLAMENDLKELLEFKEAVGVALTHSRMIYGKVTEPSRFKSGRR
jgi:hypothetical protein